jgi:hypothetical protein
VSKARKSWEDQTNKKRDRGEEGMEQDVWLTRSATILRDVKEWRKAHPKATCGEIEKEVHGWMMPVEAQRLQDTAQESSSRAWGKETGGEAPGARRAMRHCTHGVSKRGPSKAMGERAS